MSYVVITTCTTCDSGADVAVASAWVKRARCGPCIAASRPYVGDLIEVPQPPPFVPQQRAESEVELAAEHPDPEHTSRDPWPADVELPAGAARLKRDAEAAGWAVGQTYSRGWSVHGVTGKPCAYGARIALRMLHPETGNRCIVIYKDGTAESTFILGPNLPPYVGCNLTEAKEFVALAGRVLPSWLDAVKWRNRTATIKGKVWTAHHAGERLSVIAAKYDITKEQVIKIIQDCRETGKALPSKKKATKEAGG